MADHADPICGLPTNPDAAGPARVLGPFSATCIVVGSIVGIGIFFTPADVVEKTGDGGRALLAWGIAGFIALCGALVFAELGARYHASGAQYQVLRDAYGPCPAFLFVFCNATAIQAGAIAIMSYLCAQHLALAVGAAGVGPRGLALLAAALTASVIAANAVGVRWGSGIQNLTVVLKVAALAGIALLAAMFGSEGVLGPLPPAAAGDADAPARLLPLAGVLAALVPAFFSYGGWQHALWISGEIKEPRRNLPRAIVVGVALVVAIYVLTAWATLRLLGVGGVAGSEALAADAVGVVAPGWGRRATAAAVAVSAFGVLNAQLLSGPRLVYGMARDGRFFAPFARLGSRGTPTAAIMLIGGLALGLLAILFVRASSDAIDPVLNGVVFIDGVFFALTGAALFVIRARGGARQPGFRVPFYPVTPALFVVGELGVVVGSYLDDRVRGAAYVGVAWMAVAGAVYAVWFRAKRADAA